MQLYDNDGWLNMEGIIAEKYPFTFVVGGRGIGKTYGALKHLDYEKHLPYILMRRTQTQIDAISNPMLSPFAPLDEAYDVDTLTSPIAKGITGIYDGDSGKPAGNPRAVAIALATVHNIRGFSASQDFIVYDEFIPERHERAIKGEYDAFCNAYETINRNRELKGKDPVQVIALSNSNDLGNAIFLGLDIVSKADELALSDKEVWTDDARGIMLVEVKRSPVSERKRDTALYRLNQDNSFSSMALGNAFSYEERSVSRAVPLRECEPIVKLGRVCFYRHKTGGFIYAAQKTSGTPKVYTATPIDIKRFAINYSFLQSRYMEKKMVFDSYETEVLYRDYLHMKK